MLGEKAFKTHLFLDRRAMFKERGVAHRYFHYLLKVACPGVVQVDINLNNRRL